MGPPWGAISLRQSRSTRTNQTSTPASPHSTRCCSWLVAVRGPGGLGAVQPVPMQPSRSRGFAFHPALVVPEPGVVDKVGWPSANHRWELAALGPPDLLCGTTAASLSMVPYHNCDILLPCHVTRYCSQKLRDALPPHHHHDHADDTLRASYIHLPAAPHLAPLRTKLLVSKPADTQSSCHALMGGDALGLIGAPTPHRELI